MLKHFLEHTRCPNSVVEPLAARAGADLKSGGANLLSEIRSPPDAAKFIGLAQRFTGGDNQAPVTPVDMDIAIDLLRLEKYIDNKIQDEHQSPLKAAVRRTYYMMRPLFPVSFRKYLQRVALRGWDTMTFPAWPVDLSVEKLMEGTWRLLLRATNSRELPFIWFWPDGHASGCIMTHDVETQAGRDFCGTMMQMERRYGIHSAFEVVPEERYEVPDEFLQDIRDGGCEVCIHGLNHDGHLFSSEDVFFQRARKINAYAEQWKARGFRSPVMYRNLDWLPALDFSYDMSVPNVGHLDPQRGGCCTVMPYFIGELLELPLTTIQDYSLFNIVGQRSLDTWAKQIDMIRKRHGLISFIIHPDYVSDGWSSKLYETLLEYLARLRAECGVWVALPRDVDSWWRARREMTLTRENGAWKILGPEAERAKVAYASIENGNVVYRIEA